MRRLVIGEVAARLNVRPGIERVASLRATITCPHCGHAAQETVPTDCCISFYDCRGCGAVLQPKQGDCCVFCSFADLPCPAKEKDGCCGPQTSSASAAAHRSGGF